MHDLDRKMLEAAMGGEDEAGQGGLGAEREEFLEVLGEIVGEGGYEAEEEGPSGAELQGEVPETDLALELLGVSTEQELDQFLGNLVNRAAGAIRNFAKSPTGQALTGIAKSAVGQALPVVRRAVRGWARSDNGERGGSRAAGDLLGLELEGLSQEDREFETAQALVRWTADAARRAAATPPQAPPGPAAKAAAVAAAQRLAPGLTPVLNRMPVPGARADGSAPPAQPSSQEQSGRWTRRGNTVVLHGF